MSGSNYENFFDNEYEGGDLVWNEFDWQQYLNENKREINQFIKIYQNAEASFNPFEILSTESEDFIEESEHPYEQSFDSNCQDQEYLADPYTIHKHPMFVVTKGLCQDIFQSWERLLTLGNTGITPIITWQFSRALQEIDYHVVTAIYSMDISEPALAISHLKNSLSFINEALRVINQIANQCKIKPNDSYHNNIRMTLFNLRGACLRIITECRNQENEGRYLD